ncbi:MAG: hypothetical protein ACREVI_09430 [Steroidobacteraceae bacterium]
MQRRAFAAMFLLAGPAVAAEPPPDRADEEFLEFLEFLAETAGVDEEFAEYIESSAGERELLRAERQASKDEDDE